MTTQQDPPFSPLVADILTAMSTQTAAVTNAVIDGLTARATDSEAELAAIRARINGLLDGPYMPTPDAIREALWPTAAERDMFRREDDER